MLLCLYFRELYYIKSIQELPLPIQETPQVDSLVTDSLKVFGFSFSSEL